MGTPVVLVVEDNPDHALLIRIALHRSYPDLDVRVVGDGRAALGYLSGEPPFADRTRHPPPDLVILDLMLPELSGFDVLARLNDGSVPGDVPVVVLTSSVNPTDAARARKLGAAGFFTKPADLGVLTDLLRGIVEEHLRRGGDR